MTAAWDADALLALLVEDNAADAEVVAASLGSGDGSPPGPVRLLRASSVDAACDALDRHPIDVVLLDLGIGHTVGLEALHRVRSSAPDVPVVALAGPGDQAGALAALRAGAQDYILKPPPDGTTLRRILRYARERQQLCRRLDTSMRVAGRAARRWRLLAEVDEALARAPDASAAIGAVARRVVPDAADCFVLDLDGKDDFPAVLEVAHVDAARTGALRNRVRHFLDGSADPEGCEDASAPPERSFLDLVGAASGMAIPIRVGGHVHGVMILGTMPGRRDTAVDVEFGHTLADRIRLSLEQARSFRRTQRAVDARDRAVGIVSHDLGNLLSTIQICATALLDRDTPDASGMRHMGQIIQRSAAWMQQIVHDLLDRASLDAGRLALDRRPTNVSEAIGAAQAMFSPVAEEQSVELLVEGDGGLPLVHADAHRLLQVLANLLSNAMKFTPPGGRVVLAAKPSTGGVRFTVTDTGRGIPAEELPHVFDWFWQSERGGKIGTGLGLAIASGLVEAHGGRLHVESSVGHGTTFWFTLPVGDAA
jgi:signal transduction histidine kinase